MPKHVSLTGILYKLYVSSSPTLVAVQSTLPHQEMEMHLVVGRAGFCPRGDAVPLSLTTVVCVCDLDMAFLLSVCYCSCGLLFFLDINTVGLDSRKEGRNLGREEGKEGENDLKLLSQQKDVLHKFIFKYSLITSSYLISIINNRI